MRCCHCYKFGCLIWATFKLHRVTADKFISLRILDSEHDRKSASQGLQNRTASHDFSSVQFMVDGSSFMAPASWVIAQDHALAMASSSPQNEASEFMAHGSRLMAGGAGLGPGPRGASPHPTDIEPRSLFCFQSPSIKSRTLEACL